MIAKMIVEALSRMGVYKYARRVRDFLVGADPRFHRRMKKFYSQFIRPTDIVFDIGANVGDFTRVFCELGATVIAVDPNPYCVSRLKRRFKNNSKVIVVDRAISNVAETDRMYLCEGHSLSTMSPDWKISTTQIFPRRWIGEIDVETTTLDDLISQFGKPVFCKVDIEGYDWKAILGLSSEIKYISVEFFPPCVSSAVRCLSDLHDRLDYNKFNFSFGTECKMVFDGWADYCGMRDFILEVARRNTAYGGDLFAKRDDG